MAARIERLRPKSERLRREQTEQLRLFVLGLDADPEAKSAVLAAADRQTAAEEGWTFVMISAGQYGQVVEWLAAHSPRPVVALRLWALVFQHLRRDTGEITLSRQEMAEHLGCAPQHVSSIMTELEGLGAIQRHRLARAAGRRGAAPVAYFLNPRIGTHLASPRREAAQTEAPRLRLVE